MKPVLLSLALALLMVACGDGNVDSEDLEYRNGVAYLPNEETPFTGRAEGFYDNGQEMYEYNYKDGELDGRQTGWYENGQREQEENYKDGKEDGPYTGWHENGQKRMEVSFKDGDPDGLSTGWYKNGQKQRESRWKNGKLMSAVHWKPNGEKCPVTKIDEEGNGIVVWYKEDGTEDYESIYKDGELAGLTP